MEKQHEHVTTLIHHVRLNHTRRSLSQLYGCGRVKFKLRKYLKFSKCSKCIDLRRRRAGTKDEHILKATRAEWVEHINFVKNERRSYYNFRTMSREDDPEWLSVIIDGSEQKGI
jgi:hypothetical protein